MVPDTQSLLTKTTCFLSTQQHAASADSNKARKKRERGVERVKGHLHPFSKKYETKIHKVILQVILKSQASTHQLLRWTAASTTIVPRSQLEPRTSQNLIKHVQTVILRDLIPYTTKRGKPAPGSGRFWGSGLIREQGLIIWTVVKVTAFESEQKMKNMGGGRVRREMGVTGCSSSCV